MNHRVGIATVVFACTILGCHGGDSAPNAGPRGGSESSGGSSDVANHGDTGGSRSSRTTSQTGTVADGFGGRSNATGSSTGGKRAAGGSASSNSSRVASTGGALVSSGGSDATGGMNSKGGTQSSEANSKTGGASSLGGSNSAGGTTTAGGSQASGGASTSTGSGSTYTPCAASPCKVLPLGDSITHGLQSSDAGGYRSQLFKLVVAADQTLAFVGSQSAGPADVSGVPFPKNHEGHDGYTIDSGFSTYGTPGLSSRIPSPAFSTVPDIVLLHIGTNDITSTGSASATTSTRLDGLLGKIVAAAPNALIVVAQITPVSWTSADLDTYNSKIPGIVQARASQGQHVVSVDMSKMPKSGLATDGVHPNDQGYAYMAGIWHEAIRDYLR